MAPSGLNADSSGNIFFRVQAQGGAQPQGNFGSVSNFDQFETQLKVATQGRGYKTVAPFMPNITFLRVYEGSKEAPFDAGNKSKLYSFIAHRGYLSHNLVKTNEMVRAPERDTMSPNFRYPQLIEPSSSWS